MWIDKFQKICKLHENMFSQKDYIGEIQKSHLEIRSSYRSRDSFFDFWETWSILIEDFQNKILQDFFGMVDRFFKHPKNRERVLQGGKGMQY